MSRGNPHVVLVYCLCQRVLGREEEGEERGGEREKRGGRRGERRREREKRGGRRGERRRERKEGRKERREEEREREEGREGGRKSEGRREKEAGGRHNLSKPYTDKMLYSNTTILLPTVCVQVMFNMRLPTFSSS